MTTEERARQVRLNRAAGDGKSSLRPEGTRPPVSERLRAARQAKGLDLFRVERDTKIRMRFLEAIEDARYGDLPGEVYARGFLRNYAAYLGLDPDDIEHQWRAESGQPEPAAPPELIRLMPRQAIPQPMPEPVAPAAVAKESRRKAAASGAPSGAPGASGTPGERVVSIRLHLPDWHLPALRMPVLSRPAVQLPVVHRPTWQLPVVHRPSLALPAIRRPTFSKPSFDLRKLRHPLIGRAQGDAKPPAAPPAPLAAPHPGIVVQPAHVVLAAMGVVVIAITAFFGLQISGILKDPSVAVTSPSRAVLTVAAGTAQFELAGTATPGSEISISWDERDPKTTQANASGRWSFVTPLHDGLNQFDIVATNVTTNHRSQPVRLVIEVPVPTASPAPLLLQVESPTDGQVFNTTAVPVKGTTVGVTSINITPTYIGPPPAPGRTAAPTRSPAVPTAVPTLQPTLAPTPLTTPGPTHTPRPTVTPNPSGPQPVNVIPTIDGKFSAVVQLTPGVWKLTVVGSDSTGQMTSPVQLNVTVASPPVRVTIRIIGGTTYLKIWKDGVVMPAYPGTLFPGGTIINVVAYESVWIRTGSAVKTYVTVNGVSYGPLGGSRSGSWRLTAFGPPTPSNDY
jgi:hypothetical protein